VRTDAISIACENCSPPDALTGTTVAIADGRVRLGLPIAEGGFGVVYAAVLEDASGAKRHVAVKVLHARHAHDVGIARRFEREAEHARRIEHPNVISLLGAGRLADGRPLYAMERLEGATLGAIVRREGPLTIVRALGLANQIVAALAAVHDAGLVHRDLSPDNVFVTVGGHPQTPGGDSVYPRERAVLLDFGFAQPPGADAGDGVSPESPGSLVGTLTFMAPEQATRARAITERSDLFALALLLYYSLSGKLPFRGQDDLDVLVSVVRAQPIPLRRERRDAPAALEKLLSRALAKHPEARFESAHEMGAALRAVHAPARAPARVTVAKRAAASSAPVQESGVRSRLPSAPRSSAGLPSAPRSSAGLPSAPRSSAGLPGGAPRGSRRRVRLPA
jgi:serine/threonine-protein kinase